MSGHPSQPAVVAIAGADPQLYNADLAPVAPEGRTWGVFSIFAMWMSDVHSVVASPTPMEVAAWENLCNRHGHRAQAHIHRRPCRPLHLRAKNCRQLLSPTSQKSSSTNQETKCGTINSVRA